MTWTIYAQSINEFLPPFLSLLPRTLTLMSFVHVFWHFFLELPKSRKLWSWTCELQLHPQFLRMLSSTIFWDGFIFLFFTLAGCLKFFGITFNQVLWKKNEMNIIVYTNKLFKKWDLSFAIYAQSINEFLPPFLSLLPRTLTLMSFVHVFWHFFLELPKSRKLWSWTCELQLHPQFLRMLSSTIFWDGFIFLFFTLAGCLKFFGITFNQVLWKKKWNEYYCLHK